MGWWSETILGGDEPMDYVGDLEDLIGLFPYNDETDEEITYTTKQCRDAVNNNIERMVEYVEERDSYIAWHVLGAMIIQNGAKMSADIKKNVLDAISSDDSDDWKDASLRRKYIRSFRRQIQRYPLNQDTRRRTIAYEGLFENMFKHLNEGKTGLINR